MTSPTQDEQTTIPGNTPTAPNRPDFPPMCNEPGPKWTDSAPTQTRTMPWMYAPPSMSRNPMTGNGNVMDAAMQNTSWPGTTAPPMSNNNNNAILAPPVIDSRPTFTPSTYRQWKRETRLWMDGYPTATPSQFLSKIILVLPPAAKITAMSYMEATDGAPLLRSVDTLIRHMGERFAKTNTELAWAWLKAFAHFTRKPGENLNDFWARTFRVTTRLETLSMKMGGGIILPQALLAVELTEGVPYCTFDT